MTRQRAELSPKTITATTATDKVITLSDTYGSGLYIFIYPNGLKKWKLRKPVMKNGKRAIKMYDLGDFPQISLKQARQLAATWTEPKEEENKAKGATLAELYSVWLENEVKPYRAANTIKAIKQRATRHILPTLGNLKVEDITEKQIAELCEGIELEGKIPMAIYVKTALKQIFKYGKQHGYNSKNPTLEIELHAKNHKTQGQAALLDAQTIGQFLRDLPTYNSFVTRSAVLFIAYTGLRKMEALTAEWWQVDFDNAVMTIPAEKMKMGQEHKIPLSRQAVAILESLKKFGTTGYIFRGLKSGGGHLNYFAPWQCMKALGYNGEDKAEATVHGWRSTMSTILNENGFISDIIEKQLAHKAQGVRAVYNRAEYWEQRKATAQWYADYLDSLRDRTPKPQLPKGCTLTGE